MYRQHVTEASGKAVPNDEWYRYQQEVSSTMQARYPFQHTVRPGLQNVPPSFGASEDDRAQMAEKVVHPREAYQLSTPLVSSFDAKANQQPSVPAATDAQPHRFPRLSFLQKTCVVAGGSMAVVFALVLTLFPLDRTLHHPQPEETPPFANPSVSPVPSPMTAADFYRRGNTKFSQQDYQEALADYTQALTLDPQHAPAYNNRGLARAAQGDQTGAIEDYTEALTLNPQYAPAYYNRGNIRSKRGDPQGALADYQEAAKLYQQQGKTSYYQDVLNQIRKL